MTEPLTDEGPHGSVGIFCARSAIAEMGRDLDQAADENKLDKARALLMKWGADMPGHNGFDLLWAAAQLVCNILTQVTDDREKQRQLIRSFLSMIVVSDVSFQAKAVNWLAVTKQ